MTTAAVGMERSQAQVGTGVCAAGRSRLAYVDNLRILLTTLVILMHLSIGYGGPGDWYYNEGDMSGVPLILVALFVATCQAFFMGMFFMISSYFSPASYDRKGAGHFVKDRLVRLGIPLLFQIVAIQPFLVYCLWANEGFVGSFWHFLPRYVGLLHNGGAGPWWFVEIGVGPLWFVEALLAFSAAYVLWRWLARRAPAAPPSQASAPGNLAIALFALALGVVTFVLRIWVPVGWWFEPLHLQLAHFPQYIALFALGIVAYRRNWFAGLTEAQGRLWRWAALALAPLLVVVMGLGGAMEGSIALFAGGLTWQSLAYSVWEQFMAVAMIVGLLVLFRSKLNGQGRLAHAMSDASYAVYVFHAPVIVLLALALSGIAIDLALKFALVAPAAVALSFLVGHTIRKLPLARRIF